MPTVESSFTEYWEDELYAITDNGATWDLLQSGEGDIDLESFGTSAGSPTSEACSPTEPSDCYLVQKTDGAISITHTRGDASEVEWRHLDEWYVTDPWVLDDSFEPSGIYVFADGSVTATTRSGPLLHRTSGDFWSPPPSASEVPREPC